MDAVIHSAIEEICCKGSSGLHLRDLWLKLIPSLTSCGLPLCPNVKRAVWQNLLNIPGLKFDACGRTASCGSTEDLVNFTVEECEEMNAMIVAPEAMRKSFLGIYESQSSESTLSGAQRAILERLAVARANGIAQSDLAKELKIPANKLFYHLKKLEIQGLIVRQPTIIRTKKGSDGISSILSTNMLYLHRYGTHLGCHKRLEITKEDKLLINEEVAYSQNITGDDFGKETGKEDVHIKDFLPALKAICHKLEKAKDKVLVVSDLKTELGYLGKYGHRNWRNISQKLKDARAIEECHTMIDSKEVKCIRLLPSFSLSHFEPKLQGTGNDEDDAEQSMNSLRRGQITEQVVELPVLRQIYDMIDAAGSKGLTNTEICKRLGLCSKEYHKRYFKQLISRFGLHLQLESCNRCEVYRLWVHGNYNTSSYTSPVEGEKTQQGVDESNSLETDLSSHANFLQTMQVLDTSTCVGNVRSIRGTENEASALEEPSRGTKVNDQSSSTLLLTFNQQNSDEIYDEVPLKGGTTSLINYSSSEAQICVDATHSKKRSNVRYRHLAVATSARREQHVLQMLQEEKFLIKAELLRRLGNLENLAKEKSTTMDRKTLERILNKLQLEGHCKCIVLSVPAVTNFSRSRTADVVLHPSVGRVPSELLAKIHEKLRSFEIQVRQQSGDLQKRNKSIPILDNVQRIPRSPKPIDQSEHAELMRDNGFLKAKMVRTKLLHIFLWNWIRNSAGWEDVLMPTNHSCELKNPHSTYKLFDLDLAIQSMPLELYLQIVGSHQKFEDMVEKCRSGLLMCDLPVEEYRCLMDTVATGKLSRLIGILQRLKLIRLVGKGHLEDGESSTQTALAHALELKPYIEEPVSNAAPSCSVFLDLRPQVRHDFVLSNEKAVYEYWKTLEYCYAAAKPRAALLAFPGCAVHEVFHLRSWASVRVMAAGQRADLFKRIAEYDQNRKISYVECEKIAKDLNLTMEQVLRIYYDKKQQRITRFQGVLDSKSREIVTDVHKTNISSHKRQGCSDTLPLQLLNASVADDQSNMESVDPLLCSDRECIGRQGSLLAASEEYDFQMLTDYAHDNSEGSMALKVKEDDDAHRFIKKQALSRLSSARQKKFSWTEETDRQLVIEYARHRAAQGAKFDRVHWASISNLPAPPDTCKRRIAQLKNYIPFRKALMKLCNILAERYEKYLEKSHGKLLNHGEWEKRLCNPSVEMETSSMLMFEEWADFGDSAIKVALDEALRHKRIAKLEAAQDTLSGKENAENVVSGKVSRPRRLSRKYLKLQHKVASIHSKIHQSVAIANATELFKLIFLSKSTSPEVPALLAETLRHYSEHDLFAAFNYLREKKIMIGGSSNSPFALSRHFFDSISLSSFPKDTGKRAAKFSSWLHEIEPDLVEKGVDVPSDMQCGELYILCAMMSAGELSVTPCLPKEGVGEAEDNKNSKRKCCTVEQDVEQISKRSKTTFPGEGEIISRREKGFPGIRLCLHRETITRLLAIESFKDGATESTPSFCGEDQSITSSGLGVNSSSWNSGIAEGMGGFLDSGRVILPQLAMSESPWETMRNYAEYLIASCSHDRERSSLHPHLFRTLHSAIQKSGDNGLSLGEIGSILNMEDAVLVDIVIEVLAAFGRVLKVNAYDGVHLVDALYRPKYFLTSADDRASTRVQDQHMNAEDEHAAFNLHNHAAFNLHNHAQTSASLQNENCVNDNDVHRITILSLCGDVIDPSTETLTKEMIRGSQHSGVAPCKTNTVANIELLSAGSLKCRPLLPWMNGDGTLNESVYKGLRRRILGILFQHPGILEDGIISRMQGLNPQSCRQLIEIMITENHIIPRKMQQMTSNEPPSILRNLMGDNFKKSVMISRVHYFPNTMSTYLL